MKKYVDEALVGGLILVAITVVFFSGIKAILSIGENRKFLNVLLQFFVAIPCGMLGGLVALDYFAFKPSIACLIASLCCLIGEQIIRALLATNISTYFDRVAKNLIDKYTK